ncbi:hypothetical protein SAMN02745127_01901 [Oceanospirillum multiglobuliferum]|uniref:Uncharacterized protein n=1 Tax=Oceanospirillum multiglobuliferum TaxID=64969 RepID=A0A1T4QKK1_9GAMM|nr:hypothetical protein [Oceanospirillum multiglobuliferum]OPX56410.1 hypothetical protein BTE48_02980 [Oceanospirillum multiglobuliferum]SKA04011.1 hypothetical protein SAMN02745127_01901 [Oceanospirillum multiglobuliferum]
MPSNVNFNFDIAAIVSEIFGGKSERNDLAIDVQNGTNQDFHVEWDNSVGHGSFKEKEGDSFLKHVDESEKNPNASSVVLGFTAHGEGCNVVLKIKLNDRDDSYLGVMAATPSNKQNYIKSKYFDKSLSMKDLDKELDKLDKHYGDKGAFIVDIPENIKAELSIAEESPAICYITLRQS